MADAGFGRFDTSWMMRFLDPVIYFPAFCRILMSCLPPDTESGMGIDVHFNIFRNIVPNSQMYGHLASLTQSLFVCVHVCMCVLTCKSERWCLCSSKC